jgi:hypothetical protein
MKGGSDTNTKQRLEEMGRRLERAERGNRAIKIWGSIAFAAMITFGSGPFASTVLAKKKPPTLLEAQQIELVSVSGQVLASLGSDSNGTGLTIFDSSGKRTLSVGNSADGTSTGIATFDGNSIFPGTGKLRTQFGEGNAASVAPGLGFGVNDAEGKARVVGGTTVDVTQGFIETIDPNGSIAGIADDRKTFHDQGFFANDLNGKNRTFVGNSLDGTTFNTIQTADPNGSLAGIEDDSGGSLSQGLFANDLNGKNRLFAGTSLDGTSYDQISFSDTKGNFAGLLGTNSAFTPPAMDLLLVDPSGTFFAGENFDGAGVDWTLTDTNNVLRSFGDFDGTNESIEEFSPAGVLVGHLP